MLKAYFRFYWLALQEFLPEKRRKRLRVVYLVLAFIVGGIIADFFGVPLVKPLKWTYDLFPGSDWAIVLLLVAVIFNLYVVEGARRVYEKTVRLQDLAKTDLEDLSAGVRILGCEVEIDTQLETGRGWVEFRFKIFNGSVFPITLGDVSGYISFSNGHESRKLDGKFEMLPELSLDNCQRHQKSNFLLRQELSQEDVAFISTSPPSSYFIFNDLIIMVKGSGLAYEDIPAARLSTQVDDVQPRLRAAFRHDASALEAKRRKDLESRLERISSLTEVIGRGRELVRIHTAPQSIPLEDMKSFAREIETVLRRCYGTKALKTFYPFEFKGDRLERPEEYTLGPVERFIEYLNRLVVLQEREGSDAVSDLAKISC